MASLYVDRRDVHLKQDDGAIAFYENGERSATVPLAPLTRVIREHRGTTAMFETDAYNVKRYFLPNG